MTLITIIGLAAGVCTTIAFVPQAVKTWQTKSAKDLSLGMYLLFCWGTLLWLIYGILIASLPIILANAVTLLLALSILYFKLFFKN